MLALGLGVDLLKGKLAREEAAVAAVAPVAVVVLAGAVNDMGIINLYFYVFSINDLFL